jgi:acetyl-CoA carboxylase carboxyltransferase component
MHESFELVFDWTDTTLSGHTFKAVGAVWSEVPALSVVFGICCGGAAEIPFQESCSIDMQSAQRLQRAVGPALYGFSVGRFLR